MATGRVPTTANSPLTTKGDIFGYSTTSARVAVGNDGDTLLADSSQSTGLRWGATYAAGKNRVINGSMEIDQRNSGASVSATAGGQYFLDRWNTLISASSKFTVQQNAGSVTTPTQFPKYLGVTSSTAWSVGVNDYATLNQMIEGYNVSDFGLGTASAKTFTLSFWVRSSLTGTFGGLMSNAITAASATRCYPFTYSISAANTWEQKTITLTGETTSTEWATTNGKGLTVQFSLAAGTNKVTTANAWATGEYFGATGQTNILATNGATWYVTGVQVELGSVATQFTRAGGTFQGELVACQRYYRRFTGVASGNGYFIIPGAMAGATSTTGGYVDIPLNPPMRVAPTSVTYTAGAIYVRKPDDTRINPLTSFSFTGANTEFSCAGSFGASGGGLTSNNMYQLQSGGTSTNYLDISAELQNGNYQKRESRWNIY